MGLNIEDLRKEDQDEIRRVLNIGEIYAKDEDVLILHARREYLSTTLLKPFVARFRELDLPDYPKPVSAKEIAEEIKAEKE